MPPKARKFDPVFSPQNLVIWPIGIWGRKISEIPARLNWGMSILIILMLDIVAGVLGHMIEVAVPSRV